MVGQRRAPAPSKRIFSLYTTLFRYRYQAALLEDPGVLSSFFDWNMSSLHLASTLPLHFLQMFLLLIFNYLKPYPLPHTKRPGQPPTLIFFFFSDLLLKRTTADRKIGAVWDGLDGKVDCVSIKHYCEHNKLECEMGGREGGGSGYAWYLSVR